MIVLIVILLLVLIGVISSNEFRQVVGSFYECLMYSLQWIGFSLIGIIVIVLLWLSARFIFDKIKDHFSNFSFVIHPPQYSSYTTEDILKQAAIVGVLLTPAFLYLCFKPFQCFIDSSIQKLKGKSITKKTGLLLCLGAIVLLIVITIICDRG